MLKENEITTLIEKDRGSQKKRHALEGQRYYEAENDILNVRLFYVNEAGEYVEDKHRANIKIPHAFFPELVDQKVQYILSGGDFIKTEDEALKKYIKTYFGDDFIAETHELLTYCSVNGFAYMYAFRNGDGQLKFNAVDGLSVVEADGRYTSDQKDYVIYHYMERIDIEGKMVKRIQVWSDEEVAYYTQEDEGRLILDKSVAINPKPHYAYEEDGEYFSESFGYIPFFRLDNNRKKFTDLKPIKALIDDYDLMSCGLSNNLQDTAETLYVVRGFEGNDVGELIENVKVKHYIGVDHDGGVDQVTVPVPYEARKAKMELDEKSIYRFGMGFNAAAVGDGNVTNVVIKSRYALLDLKCSKMELRLKAFLKQVIQIVLDEINKANDTGYTVDDVNIEFDHEIITNETDNAQIELAEAQTKQTEITTLLNTATKLPGDTVLKALCDILDLDYEDIKDKVDLTDPALDINAASEALGGMIDEPAPEAG
ncbi:phage portal protein, SPP1 family [Eubacterium aggregans]|uniref:Phage portal protein, SPP1 family n=1 Tax=Eubacterium aggregans TaxID=81409 RepID=A0A1H3YVQ7_9FIRM|nr:phage portal protein [Eubacterium aggregans]SEA15655.1 phage portal protein, SPP1 family [Eubacterium aggregans]